MMWLTQRGQNGIELIREGRKKFHPFARGRMAEGKAVAMEE
jgi:hypothetical protein